MFIDERRTMRRIILLMGLLMGATIVTDARAATLFVTAEQHNPGRVTNPGRFEAIIGFPKQCVQGIPCWQYQKGSRSGNRHWPESWYVHQDGRRVVDHVFHLYVMDPRSRGWEHHVASVCSHRCFLDGLGISSLSRTTPRLRWSPALWVSRAALVVRAVERAGKYALPNSVATGPLGVPFLRATGGRVSTESMTASNARSVFAMGSVWATEIGGCLAKYHAFLRWRGRSDRFACYEHGHLPWDTSWLR